MKEIEDDLYKKFNDNNNSWEEFTKSITEMLWKNSPRKDKEFFEKCLIDSMNDKNKFKFGR